MDRLKLKVLPAGILSKGLIMTGNFRIPVIRHPIIRAGNHEVNIRLPSSAGSTGRFHITTEFPEENQPGVFAHFDTFNPTRGPEAVLLHGLEVDFMGLKSKAFGLGSAPSSNFDNPAAPFSFGDFCAENY